MVVPSGAGFLGPQRRGCADLTGPRREQARGAEAPENGHSQKRAPGVTPENAAGQPPQRAGLTPENAELLTEYGGYLERSHLAGPSRCCGGRAGPVRRTGVSAG
jgi:hypothetical protein